MLRKSLGKLLLFVLLISVIATGVIKLGWAQPTEITVVNPQTGDGNFIFYTNETTIGTRFNSTVWLYNVTDLYMYQVMLNVDDTLLNITNARCPTWDPQWVFKGKSTLRPAPSFYDDDGDGYYESVLVGAAILSGASFTGNGTLAIIEFEIVYAPTGGNVSCGLDIDNPDTFLVDSYSKLIPTAKTSGYYEYVVPAIIYAEPAEVSDLVPDSYFDINITIAKATDVYSFKFNLSYDPTVLNAVNAMLGNFFPPTVVPEFVINNTVGYLFFSASLSPPETPVSGSGILAVITFHVEGLGATALDLYDTELADESDKTLPHTAEDGFFSNISLIRDVAIVNVVSSLTFVYAGALVGINVTAQNKGNVTETFDIKAYYDTNLIKTKTVIKLPPNVETTLTFTWNTSGVSDGIYKIKGEATFVPDEFNTTDNVYIDGTVEVSTRIRDLAILSVTVNPNITYVGWPVNITVVAENQGMDPENFEVSVYWNDTQLIGNPQTVTNLAPTTKITLTFTWNTSNTLECNKYKISAEATLIPEFPIDIDTDDNKLDDGYVKIKHMGDVNSDGVVDMRDMQIIVIAFGSYIGHPRWNPEADLNRDSKVDIVDLAMVVSNVRKTCSS